VDIPSALLALRALNERDDLFPKLAEVDLPALVLVGSEDRSLPPERSRRLAGALPRAWFVEIQGAGHLSSLEQPTAVTNAMLDFLRRTDTIEQQRCGPTRG
jgi:pimeloyl-ACP methyl ester carboxylesterase